MLTSSRLCHDAAIYRFQALAEARAAKKLPWDGDKLLVYRAIFPQMAGWPPKKRRHSCGSNSTPRWPSEGRLTCKNYIRRRDAKSGTSTGNGRLMGRMWFPQRGDLQKQRNRIDVGMIVRQQIERHRGYLRQQFIERGGIGGGWNVVAMAAQWMRHYPRPPKW